MAYQKLQVSRGLVVIPSNTVDIPFPGAEITSSTTTGASALKLIDSAGDFVNKGIKIGDIVYADVAATVTAIDSATQLSVTTAVATTTAYKIYTPGKNSGCVLYVGTTGNINVITAGGDTVLFTAMPVGMFMPVEVTRVMFTGTVGSAAIVALW